MHGLAYDFDGDVWSITERHVGDGADTVAPPERKRGCMNQIWCRKVLRTLNTSVDFSVLLNKLQLCPSLQTSELLHF